MKFKKSPAKPKPDGETKPVPKTVLKQDDVTTPEIPEVSYGPIHIYFGSQTGTAANYAQILGEESSKNGFQPKIIDLIDFDVKQLKSCKLATFLMATHGEGEPTDNAKAFNEWISDSERTNEELKGVKFLVFGLGNKQYQFYNAQGRKINEYMEKLGAERIYKYGEGDDNDSLEDDFNEWKSGLWEGLKSVVQPVRSTERKTTKTQSNLPFIVNTTTEEKEINLETFDVNSDNKEYEFQMKQYLLSASANITLIRELRQRTDDGSTVHIEIDNGSVGVSYRTADNLAMFPENDLETVEKVAKLLGLNLDEVFTLEENEDVDKKIKFKFPFPTPCSVRTFLTKFCDLHSPIRKKQLKDLSEFCAKPEDKAKLALLASPGGKIEFEAQVNSCMLGLVDIIEKYDVKVNLANLIHISSLVQPRYYTIASSSRRDPGSVHLCFAMQLDVLPDGKKRLGLTSKFMSHLFNLHKQGKPLPKVKISIKESSFQLPAERHLPIYMVGPGAGIAPFKAFADEKDFVKKQGEEDQYGPMTLYFGCKARNWDYLYKEELLRYHDEKLIENYHVAFSREQEQKVYVQDLLEKNKDNVIVDIFEKEGSFYICGSMGMGKAVVKKLIDFAMSHYKMDLTTATHKIEEMEKTKKIIKELWG